MGIPSLTRFCGNGGIPGRQLNYLGKEYPFPMHPTGDTELLQIMDAAFAEAARKAGSWLACRPGCTQCCHGVFAINALDAERLRAGMETLRATDPALATRLTTRSRAWLEVHGSAFRLHGYL